MPHDIERELELLQEATQRLVRTVDGFQGDDWAAPSGLPDWTRAHVVAHLALNAEGLAGALAGIVEDEEDDAPMYASDEARDTDIEELAQDVPSRAPRARLHGRGHACSPTPRPRVPEDALSDARSSGRRAGRTFPAAATVGMRLREVEIHHADLARRLHPPRLAARVLRAAARRDGQAGRVARAVPGRPDRPRPHLVVRRGRPDRRPAPPPTWAGG